MRRDPIVRAVAKRGADGASRALSDPADAGTSSDDGGVATPAPGVAWLYLFDPDGAVVGSNGGDREPPAAPVRDLADLGARFRQTDGIPLELAGRSRRLAVHVSGTGRRVVLATEPIAPVGDAPGFPTLAVAVVPFGPEDEPRTLNTLLGSVLAHELRTPLTTVYAGADLLSAERVSDSTRRDAARSVAREAARLERIVEDLLVLVRTSIEPPPDPELVLLRPLLEEAAARQRRLDDGATIELRVPKNLPPVLGSDVVVHHLMRNLLEHALARSPAAVAITVEAERHDSMVEVRVVDRGPAADDRALAAAFELFASLPGTTDASGANLSMVVARRLAERIGGAVRAETRPDGTASIVSLPVADHDPVPDEAM